MNRSWNEKANMLLSLLNCVVPQHDGVLASSEFFTGKKFYNLCFEHEVKTAEELERKLGPEYRDKLLTQNKEEGTAFAQRLRELGHKIVLTPALFDAGSADSPNWSGGEYLAFWDLVIAKKCHTIYLNNFWEFSDSCVFHYLAGLKTGKKVLDYAGNFVLLDAARKMVLSATRRLEDLGFEVPNLHKALLELKSFSSLG